MFVLAVDVVSRKRAFFDWQVDCHLLGFVCRQQRGNVAKLQHFNQIWGMLIAHVALDDCEQVLGEELLALFALFELKMK
eukprot:2837879-Pleurochrysis_carterae.AAC.1